VGAGLDRIGRPVVPGQITHFYLASRVAETFSGKSGIRKQVHDGFKKWLALNREFETKTNQAVIDNDADKMQATVNAYRDALLASDDVAVFSAFCAGAVGPDVWTLPVSGLGTLATKGVAGGWYFDLGHYNLSHIFPEYTLKKIRGLPDDLQRRYRTAYVLGFISHISLDILAHLTVNVFAGAYHKQQQAMWETEQGNIKEKINKLNNHNKIEHYLDAFIRFFCFEGWYSGGAHAATYRSFKKIVEQDFGQKEPWRFPNYTDYFSKIMRFGRVIITNGITNDPDEYFLDLSTSLPGPFAHRYHVTGDKAVQPFLREYYANAYADKVEDWLKSGHESLGSINSEIFKLEYFNFIDDQGWRDINDEVSTQYYYIHTVIPNLEKVVANTTDFYSPGAFGHFIQGSMKIASDFIDHAVKYLDTGDSSQLDCLKFWNLDTGQAIRIRKGPTDRGHLVPVSLDIESVLDLPCLNGWSIPQMKEIRHKQTKTFAAPVPAQAMDGCEAKGAKFNSGQAHVCVCTDKIAGLELKVRQTCFYGGDKDDEIGATIFGSSERASQPWVIQGEKHGGQRGYDMIVCVENFKSVVAKIESGKSSGRKSKTYSTVFTGKWGLADTPADKPVLTAQQVFPLPRHVKVTTLRKLVSYVTDSGNFRTSKLGSYVTAYPSEDLVFSIFMLVKNGKSYRDVFQKGVVFDEKQLASLKKIQVIGVNTILLILDGSDGTASKLSEAWVDGEKVTVK
jgi:hypothetical protein